MTRNETANDRGVLLICGVAFRTVPMLEQLERWLADKRVPVTIVQLEHKNRMRFIAKSILACIKNRGSTVILVNPQALVVLLLVQCIPFQKHQWIYWAFESSNTAPPWSPVWAGIWAEKLIRRDKVDLIVPLAERSEGMSPGYRNTYVFENVAGDGRAYIPRSIAAGKPIRLVIYGGLRPSHTYVLEFIEMVKANPQYFELTLIGDFDALADCSIAAKNIICHARLSHEDLIDTLKKSFHYSIVGYKPVSFNHRYCAPNKLFESYSLSLPVLANRGNPTLRRLVAECGVLADFDSLRAVELYSNLQRNYPRKVEASYLAYKDTYNFEARAESVLSRFL